MIWFIIGCSKMFEVSMNSVIRMVWLIRLEFVVVFIVVELYSVVVVFSLCMFSFFFMIVLVFRKLMFDIM